MPTNREIAERAAREKPSNELLYKLTDELIIELQPLFTTMSPIPLEQIRSLIAGKLLELAEHEYGEAYNFLRAIEESQGQQEPSLNRTISEMVAYRFKLRQVTESLLAYAESVYPYPSRSGDDRATEAEVKRKEIVSAAKEVLYNTAISGGADTRELREALRKFVEFTPRTYYGWRPESEDELRPIFAEAERVLAQGDPKEK